MYDTKNERNPFCKEQAGTVGGFHSVVCPSSPLPYGSRSSSSFDSLDPKQPRTRTSVLVSAAVLSWYVRQREHAGHHAHGRCVARRSFHVCNNNIKLLFVRLVSETMVIWLRVSSLHFVAVEMMFDRALSMEIEIGGVFAKLSRINF